MTKFERVFNPSSAFVFRATPVVLAGLLALSAANSADACFFHRRCRCCRPTVCYYYVPAPTRIPVEVDDAGKVKEPDKLRTELENRNFKSIVDTKPDLKKKLEDAGAKLKDSVPTDFNPKVIEILESEQQVEVVKKPPVVAPAPAAPVPVAPAPTTLPSTVAPEAPPAPPRPAVPAAPRPGA
jgi:hypothetical protein